MLQQPWQRRSVMAVVFLIAIAFIYYAGDKSFVIASYGATNQIPQLLGDGGAGMLFAGVCLISALLSLFLRRTGAILYVVAAALVIGSGCLYEDNGMFIWAIPPLLFAGANIWLYLVRKKTTHAGRSTRVATHKG